MAKKNIKKNDANSLTWDLGNVYSGMESADFVRDWKKLVKLLNSIELYFKDNNIKKAEKAPAVTEKTAAVIGHAVEMLNTAISMYMTMESYIYSYYSTDSYNTLASKKISEIEQLSVKISNLDIIFKGYIGSLGKNISKLVKSDSILKEHEFFLYETAEQSKFMMSEAEEKLASELSLSGGQAFGKLQGVLTSQLKTAVKIKNKIEEMPITKIRNMAYDRDEKIRKAGYEAEMKGWAALGSAVAASLNGVKGHNITLNIRRGRKDGIESSLDNNRIDRKTLDAMLMAMRESFPTFRKYFKKKAERFGQKALPWWNLLAPVGKSNKTYTYPEACDFIVKNFSEFSAELGNFARHAFENRWIDVEPRDGKRGGAFCMEVPGVEESRILCNFDGSLDQVSTIAHELGHAFHNYCQKGLTVLQKSTPMTLAETASIFCETIVTNAALKEADAKEKLSILETQLINESQVIVDIYSRFLFEQEVFERREKSELAPEELCEIMVKAQKECYGSGLDHKYLHPYMWVLKPHYYSPGAAFYNYPYAFGLLFSLGLYKIYEAEGGKKFVPRYKELLRSTGQFKAADLTKKFGIDITTPDFWRASLKISEDHVKQYLKY